MSELQQLRDKAAQLPYPDGIMEKADGGIKGLGFFPGGSGLYGADTKISNRKIMILGQDLDKAAGYQRSIEQGDEAYTSTWRQMTKLFEQANIRLADCFFTNAIMGVRADSTSNTGKSPAFRSAGFIEACLDFLMFQISLQRPQAILCLGKVPAELLSRRSALLKDKLKGKSSFKAIDDAGLGVIEEVQFEGMADFRCQVGLLVHPSYRQLNAKSRRYAGHEGEDAELAILRAVMV